MESDNQLRARYRRQMNEYKRSIVAAKEDIWKQFVNTIGNEKPWGRVYKVCMNDTQRDSIRSLIIESRNTVTWNKSINVLLDRFFLAAETPAWTDSGDDSGEQTLNESELENAMISLRPERLRAWMASASKWSIPYGKRSQIACSNYINCASPRDIFPAGGSWHG